MSKNNRGIPAYTGLTAADSSVPAADGVDGGLSTDVVEVTTPVVSTPAPAPSAPPPVERPPVTPPAAIPADDYITVLTKNKTEGSVAMKSAIASVEQYLLGMKPGKTIVPSSGALIQYLFWKSLLAIINQTPANEFKAVWGMVIAIVREHRSGTFLPKYTTRFSADWKWGQSTISTYMRLLHLMTETANPDNTIAKVSASIDLDKVMDDYFISSGRDNLHTYYSV
jgi:hypothetical protein